MKLLKIFMKHQVGILLERALTRVYRQEKLCRSARWKGELGGEREKGREGRRKKGETRSGKSLNPEPCMKFIAAIEVSRDLSAGGNNTGVKGEVLRVFLMSKQEKASEVQEEEDLRQLARSIDRSRKRHLSVGLLRGDLVQDRLRQQEETASPLLKKNRPDPTSPRSPPELYFSPTETAVAENQDRDNMALTLAQLKLYMDENTNKKIDNVEVRLGTIESSVAGNTTRLDAQAASISANARSIQDIKAEVDKLKKTPFPPLPAPLQGNWGAGPRVNEEEVSEFRRARKSLRLWPVNGRTKDDLWHEAGIFMGTNLGMQGKLDRTKIEEIVRPEIPSGPGAKDEVLVRFTDDTTRDMVLGAAALLAPFVDDQGKPTAGLRIEVPKHLRTEFRLLFKYGQNLRARHGKGTRRHVKFDDGAMTLFLNVRLPGDESWSRVSVEVARRGLRAREAANDEHLERRMDITGPLEERPRSASTSAAAADVSRPGRPMGSAWTTRRSDSTSI